jgi:hypothetical protein
MSKGTKNKKKNLDDTTISNNVKQLQYDGTVSIVLGNFCGFPNLKVLKNNRFGGFSLQAQQIFLFE